MVVKRLKLVNGLPRMVAEIIYDETLEVVASGAGAGQINVDDAQAVDNITLPNAGTYVGDELLIFLNGQLLNDGVDFSNVSSTEISMTFDLAVTDRLRFYKKQ